MTVARLRDTIEAVIDDLDLSGSSPGEFSVDDPAYGAVGDGITDDTVAIQAAFNAAVAANGTLLFTPGKTYRSSIINWLGNNTGWVTISGYGATFKFAATGTKGFINPTGLTSGNYSKLRILGLKVDANNYAPTAWGFNGVVFNGGLTTNTGYDQIVCRDVETLNVAHQPNGSPFWISFDCSLGRYGTWTVESRITNILVENVVFGRIGNGGNYGCRIQLFDGLSSPNGPEMFNYGALPSINNGYKAPCSFDNIIIRNGYHRSQTSPPGTTFSADSSIIIGNHGHGDKVIIDNWNQENSGDNGIEVDSMLDVTIRNCNLANGETGAYFFANLGGMPTPEKQNIVLDNCIGRGGASGSGAFAATFKTYAPGGNIVLRDCRFFDAGVNVRGPVNNVTVENLGIIKRLAAVNSTSGQIYLGNKLYIDLLGGKGVVRIDGLTADEDFTITNNNTGASNQYYPNILVIEDLADHALIVDGIQMKSKIYKTAGAGGSVGIRPIPVSIREGGNLLQTDAAPGSTGSYFYDTANSADVLVSGGVLTSVTNHSAEKRALWLVGSDFWKNANGPFTDVGWVVKSTPGATITDYKAGTYIKRKDASNYVEAYVTDDGVKSFHCIDKVIAGVRTSLLGVIVDGGAYTVSTITTPTAYQADRGIELATRISTGTAFWVRGIIRGNTVLGDYYTSSPTLNAAGTSAAGTASGTLTAAGDISAVGRSTQGTGGFSWVPISSDATLDDLTNLRLAVMQGKIANFTLLEASTDNADVWRGLEMAASATSSNTRITSAITVENWDASRAAIFASNSDPTIDSTLRTKFIRKNYVTPTAAVAASVTAPGTGVAYTNTDMRELQVVWSGGTLTTPFVEVSLDDGVTWVQVFFANDSGSLTLQPGDQIRWTYSSAPTIRKVPVR